MGLLKIFFSFVVIFFNFQTAFPNGHETNVALGGYVSVITPAKNLPDLLGLSDNHYYVKTGLDLANGGSLSTDSQFSLRQWAPGTSFTFAFLIKLFGEDIPLGIFWGIFSVALWSIIYILLLICCRSWISLFLTMVAILFLVTAFPFTTWIYRGGFLYSEGVSIGFAILSFLVLKSSGYYSKYLAGSLLAIAAYFKGTFEFVGLVATGILLIIITLKVAQTRFEFLNRSKTAIKGPILRDLTLFLIPFHILTIPWRIWSDWQLYPSHINFQWNSHISSYWGHRWMPTGWLEASGSSWFANNGGNSACILDLLKCNWVSSLELPSGGNYGGGGYFSQKDFLILSLQTFMSNPLGWVKSRIPFLTEAWIPSNTLFWQSLWGYTFLTTVIFITLIVLLGNRLFIQFNLTMQERLIYISFLIGILGPLLIQQIEPRYLYPIQILSFLIFLRLARQFIDAKTKVKK